MIIYIATALARITTDVAFKASSIAHIATAIAFITRTKSTFS